MHSKRVVVITGAASGIGAAIARELASADVSLVLHSRGADPESRQSMERVLSDVQSQGACAQVCYADLSQPGAGSSIINHCVQHFGRVDQLVSNAGHASKKDLHTASCSDLAAAVQSMAGAFMELVQASRDYLVQSSCGSIVLTSSFVAHRYKPDELYPLTAAAKAAAESLAMTLAAELSSSGVTVNCVVPGYTLKDTSRHPAPAWQERLPKPPLGRFAHANDIAGAVSFLLSSKARYITGQRLAVDGGLQLG